MSRTNAKEQRELYSRIPATDAAKRLGISVEHLLELGRAGEIDILDLRRPGSPRGVYRVAPASLEEFAASRRVGA